MKKRQRGEEYIILCSDSKRLLNKLKDNAYSNGVCDNPSQIMSESSIAISAIDILEQMGEVIPLPNTGAILVTEPNNPPKTAENRKACSDYDGNISMVAYWDGNRYRRTH